MDDAPRWEPMDPTRPNGIWSLRLGSDELARVQERVDGSGWVSNVAMHREDWRRRMHAVAPSQRLAMKWAERWTLANLARIRGEMRPLVETQCGTRSLGQAAVRLPTAPAR